MTATSAYLNRPLRTLAEAHADIIERHARLESAARSALRDDRLGATARAMLMEAMEKRDD